MPPIADSPLRSLSILYRKSHIWLSEGCAPCGLTAAQAVVILVVCDHGALTQDEITKRLSLDKSVVAKTVAKLEETAKKVDESLALSRQRLDQLKTALANRISDLTNRLEDEKQKRESLKRELVAAQKKLEMAEKQRDARIKKDTDLLSVANEAAIFILTSLELQERDPTKDQVTAQSSSLNKVIRKINNLSQDLTGVQPKQSEDVTQSQSIKTVRKWMPSGKAESPTKTRTIRPTKKTEDFRNSPEYQRIFGKDAGSSASTTAKAKMLRILRTGNR